MSTPDPSLVGPPPPLPPGLKRAMIVITTMLVSVIAVLDVTIVTVNLPYIQGTLSATPDTITWIVTMYTIGMAIGTAATGRIADQLGRKRVMIGALLGFIVFSALCGQSRSLEVMVLFRFCQGVVAAPLIPLSQSVLIDAYPPEERTKGLSLWVVGVMAGPAVGPALGGALTQAFNWPPVFYINVPIGAVAVLLCATVLRSTPGGRDKVDWTSVIFISIFVVGLQIVLDKGNDADWFWSRLLAVLMVISIAGGVLMVYRGVTSDRSVLDLTLFADRNFAIGTVLVTLIGLIFFGVLVFMPDYLETDLGWQVNTSGLLIGSLGVGGFVSSLMSAPLERRFGARPVIMAGVLIMAAALAYGSRLNLDAGPIQVIKTCSGVGFGMILAFVTLTSLAFASIAPERRNQASALFNFTKTVGMSIGVTFVATISYRGNQSNWNQVSGSVTPWSPGLQPFTDLAGGDWGPRTAAVVTDEFERQVAMITVTQGFAWLAGLAILMAILVLLAGGTRRDGSGAEVAA